jgi:hypothetical protein
MKTAEILVHMLLDAGVSRVYGLLGKQTGISDSDVSARSLQPQVELQAGILTIDQVREVLYVAGQIVNGLTAMWDNSLAQLAPMHTDDYTKSDLYVE